jgi:hypothetical protein
MRNSLSKLSTKYFLERIDPKEYSVQNTYKSIVEGRD